MFISHIADTLIMHYMNLYSLPADYLVDYFWFGNCFLVQDQEIMLLTIIFRIPVRRHGVKWISCF